MEREDGGIENPWIAVSKRKRAHLSGAQYEAAKYRDSKADEAVEKLPTNGFLSLTLHEPDANDEQRGHSPDGTSNPEPAPPSSPESVVRPRKRTKKDPKKVSSPNRQTRLTAEILSFNEAKRRGHKPTSCADSTPPFLPLLTQGLSRFGTVDARRRHLPRMD
jgi:hypothetical protein